MVIEFILGPNVWSFKAAMAKCNYLRTVIEFNLAPNVGPYIKRRYKEGRLQNTFWRPMWGHLKQQKLITEDCYKDYLAPNVGPFEASTKRTVMNMYGYRINFCAQRGAI
jgi:hypothetical protein